MRDALFCFFTSLRTPPHMRQYRKFEFFTPHSPIIFTPSRAREVFWKNKLVCVCLQARQFWSLFWSLFGHYLVFIDMENYAK